MVEFLLVLMPLLTLFLAIIELSRYGISGLMVQRAAGIAVRACAVVKDQPRHCDSNLGFDDQNTAGQDATITLAATEAMRPLTEDAVVIQSAVCQTDVQGVDGAGQAAREASPDRVEVLARYRCVVPLARDLLCRESDPQRRTEPDYRVLKASAQYGHQGARYDCQ